jgi:hypothetical protein
MVFKYAEWKTLTKTIWSRSTALKAVDDWFEKFENSQYQNQKYLDNLSQAFKTWSDTKQKTETIGMMQKVTYKTGRAKKIDQTTGKNAIELIKEFITSHKVSNVVHKEQVTGLIERVAIVERQNNPFSHSEGAKVQEAVRTLAVAIRTARDVVIAAKSPGNDRTLYEKWFGAFETQRHKTVRDRFQILDEICTKKGIIFNDGRDDPTAAGAFAWAYPGEERNFPNMWLGDAFFSTGMGTGRRRQAFGDTLGTLVHELTHACFNTADIPEEALIDTTARDQWGNPVDYGNVAVCNDPKNDCRLAERRPAEAIRNADNYGEFVVDAHTGLHFVYTWP